MIQNQDGAGVDYEMEPLETPKMKEAGSLVRPLTKAVRERRSAISRFSAALTRLPDRGVMAACPKHGLVDAGLSYCKVCHFGRREGEQLEAVTVIADPTPDLAERYPDIDWSRGVVAGVEQLLKPAQAHWVRRYADERAHADRLAEALDATAGSIRPSNDPDRARAEALLAEHKRRRDYG